MDAGVADIVCRHCSKRWHGTWLVPGELSATASTSLEKLGRRDPSLAQPFLFGSVVAIPLSQTGLVWLPSLMRRYMDTDLVVALCGHPFQALDSARGENSEHVDWLAELLSTFERNFPRPT